MSGQTFFRPGLDKPVDSLVMSKTCGGSYDEWANLFMPVMDKPVEALVRVGKLLKAVFGNLC